MTLNDIGISDTLSKWHRKAFCGGTTWRLDRIGAKTSSNGYDI